MWYIHNLKVSYAIFWEHLNKKSGRILTMKRGVLSDAMLHCLARSSLSCFHLPLLAIFGIIILCKTSITVHYYQIIIIMKITITMIFPKESRTKSRGRCSHINVTHWHSTRLTGDKTKTNVTDCHDDDAYTVTDRDGAALSDSDIDALTFIEEFTYLRQSPSHGVLTYTLNSTCFVYLSWSLLTSALATICA